MWVVFSGVVVLIIYSVIKALLKMSSDSSSESDIEENLRSLKLEDKDINILLLGETGVGKSTFINALANYLSQKYFDVAEKEGLVVLIPSLFEIADKKGKRHEIKVGPEKDKNEVLETGESATRDVKTYVFPVWRGRVNVRLIDTPGMGDTRGIEQDEKNCDYILRYLRTLKKIHAICFLFKPTEARKTVFFEYCLSQILSRLDKTACKNIFFLFTNTRGSDYGPGDTFSNLKSFVAALQKKTPGINIDVNTNKFCFDNEAFKFLAAVEKKVKFDDSMREVNLKSWRESASQCWRLIRHAQRETVPYATENLLLVDTTRRILLRLSRVLADITKLTDSNQVKIEKLEVNINIEKQEIDDLKRNKTDLFNVERIQIDRTMLVCTSRTCADVYRVNGMLKWHYRTVCHNHCYETSNEVKDMIGSPMLVNCNVINKTTRCCIKCGCDFSVHKHIDYMTRLVQNTFLGEDIHLRIATRESLLDTWKEDIIDMKLKNEELFVEYNTIQKMQSKMALFLLKNAIVAKSDCYKEYIVYLINQNQTVGASATGANQDLKGLLKEHEETEKAFQRALKMYSPSSDLPFDGQDLVKKDLEKLFSLAHSGGKIRGIYAEQQTLENQPPPAVKEYVHKKFYEKEEDQKNKHRRGGNQDGKKDGRRNDNFSQKQRDRKGSEKQRDFDSRNRNNEPRRDFSRDQRYQQNQSAPSPVHPQGAHRGYPDRDRIDRRYEQGSRIPPPPYQEVAHGGYPDPQHYRTDYRGPNYPPKGEGNYDFDLKVTVTSTDPRSSQEAFYPPGASYGHAPQQAQYPPQQAHYPPQQAHYPPQQAHYPPPQAHYPPAQGHYPPNHGSYPAPYGAYPPQYPYPAPPKGPYNQGPHTSNTQNASRPVNRRDGQGGRRNDNPPREGNRRDNQEGRRNADRRGRGGHREGRGRDGRPTFKSRNRKPKNQGKKDDSDSDSYESVASSVH